MDVWVPVEDGSGHSPTDRSLAELMAAALRKAPVWGRMVSDSMYPYLRAGQDVLLAPIEGAAGRLRWGAVVAFVRDGRVCVHRVRGAAGRRHLWTRGDNRGAADRPVAVDEVVGLVVRVRTEGRRRGRVTDLLLGSWSVLRCLLRAGWYGWVSGSVKK